MRIAGIAILLLTWSLSFAQELVITNGRIIDGTGQVIDNGSVVIRDGLIAAVVRGGPAESAALRIDARGMTVMPGMINTHWHLLVGTTADSSAAVDRFVDEVVADELKSLLQRGVTTIMSLGDHYPDILDVRQRVVDGELAGPRLLIAGPVFTAPGDWPTQICDGNSYCMERLNVQVSEPQQARAKVREVAAAGVDAVKLVYDDVTVPGVRIDDDVVAAIADEARLHGLTLYAHVSTVEETAVNVVNLGVGALVHPVSFRAKTGINGARYLRDMNIPVSTTISGMSRDWYDLTGREYTDAVQNDFNRRLEDIRHLWDEGVIVAFGTDTVAGQSKLSAGMFLLEARALNQVISNEEVLATLTRNAALFLGLEDELGTLIPGKTADVILIDGDPLADISDLMRVEVVIQEGQVVVDNRLQ